MPDASSHIDSLIITMDGNNGDAMKQDIRRFLSIANTILPGVLLKRMNGIKGDAFRKFILEISRDLLDNHLDSISNLNDDTTQLDKIISELSYSFTMETSQYLTAVIALVTGDFETEFFKHLSQYIVSPSYPDVSIENRVKVIFGEEYGGID